MHAVTLTRPLPCSNELQTALERLGIRVLHLPTLQLNATQSSEQEKLIQTNWHAYTGILFVSQHAAQFAFIHMQRLGLKPTPNTWLGAVGQGTLTTLQSLWPAHTHFITPSPHDSQDSEGLWRAIQTNTRLEQQSLLIVRAQTGRDVLLHMAQKANIPCAVWACYTRNACVWSDEQIQQFQQFNTPQGLIVITSIEGLQALMKQFEPQHLPKNFFQHTIVTIHPRIAEFAQAAGFHNVRLCAPAELSKRIPIWANAQTTDKPLVQG